MRELALIGLLGFSLASCMTAPSHPCQDGGEPARLAEFSGNRRCTQKRTPDGHYINHGLYQEWHINGQLALEGHYKMGKKDGIWTEYNEDGRKISEKYFEDGIEGFLQKSPKAKSN